jgi:hypothetical protein
MILWESELQKRLNNSVFRHSRLVIMLITMKKLEVKVHHYITRVTQGTIQSVAW